MRRLAKSVCCVVLLGSGCVGLAAGPVAPAPVPILLGARPEMRGMRVKEIRWDAVLRQSWAVLEDTDHPQRPLWAALTGVRGPSGPIVEVVPQAPASAGSTLASFVTPVVGPTGPPPQVIHYGDQVTLWKSEKNIRLQLNAIAEGNAAAGQELTLRIPSAGANGDAAWRVKGIARGPGNVEMQP